MTKQTTSPEGYVPPQLGIRLLARIYLWIFGRKAFYAWNNALLVVAARGICVSDPMLETIGPAETTFLRRVARLDHPTVFDVGANVGSYSAMLKRLCPTARIWAFEPNPGTFRDLSSVALNADFTAVRLALSDREGGANLYDYASSPGSPHASLHREVIEGIHASSSTVFEVELSTVDVQLSRLQLDHLTLLKVEAEGHEMAVLRGASEAIAAGRIDVIQFEFNEMNVVSRVFVRDFYDHLRGYTLYRMVVDGLAPLGPYRARTHELFFLHNLVAVRHDLVDTSTLL